MRLKNIAYDGRMARLYNTIIGVHLTLNGDLSYYGSERAISHVPPCESMLSIGGGTGELESELAQRCLSVLNHDLSRGMVKEAMRRHAVMGVSGAGEALPYGDGSFDCVFMNESLGHMRHKEVIGESFRVLRRGGTLVVNAHENALRIRVLKNFSASAIRYTLFSQEELVSLARDAGFRDAKAERFRTGLGTPFVRLVATK